MGHHRSLRGEGWGVRSRLQDRVTWVVGEARGGEGFTSDRAAEPSQICMAATRLGSQSQVFQLSIAGKGIKGP